jgi:transcriptional regulator with XRE-family HTH domain
MEFATIGSALSSRRKALNIDQARAAATIGMSRTTFSSYERDLQRPSADVLPSLAQFLEIPIDDVLTLYGGTCIEALRPALERFLATQSGVLNIGSTVGEISSEEAVKSEEETEHDELAGHDEPESSDEVASEEEMASYVELASTDEAARGEETVSYEEPHRTDEPVDVEDLVTAAAVPKEASLSIFANELSDDAQPVESSPPTSTDLYEGDLKTSKKSGKKKKGKKGKKRKIVR